jgi:hypothetical protein
MSIYAQGSGTMAATLGSGPQPLWGREMHLSCDLSSYHSFSLIQGHSILIFVNHREHREHRDQRTGEE